MFFSQSFMFAGSSAHISTGYFSFLSALFLRSAGNKTLTSQLASCSGLFWVTSGNLWTPNSKLNIRLKHMKHWNPSWWCFYSWPVSQTNKNKLMLLRCLFWKRQSCWYFWDLWFQLVCKNKIKKNPWCYLKLLISPNKTKVCSIQSRRKSTDSFRSEQHVCPWSRETAQL